MNHSQLFDLNDADRVSYYPVHKKIRHASSACMKSLFSCRPFEGSGNLQAMLQTRPKIIDPCLSCRGM